MTIQQKINRATGRAIVGIGVRVAVETKEVTHVISGTLKRSVHAAPEGYDGYEIDADALADEGDLLFVLGPPHATQTKFGAVIEVGSWLPYACAEWVGRGHPGVTQGLEMTRGRRADLIVAQAFREEGL